MNEGPNLPIEPSIQVLPKRRNIPIIFSGVLAIIAAITFGSLSIYKNFLTDTKGLLEESLQISQQKSVSDTLFDKNGEGVIAEDSRSSGANYRNNDLGFEIYVPPDAKPLMERNGDYFNKFSSFLYGDSKLFTVRRNNTGEYYIHDQKLPYAESIINGYKAKFYKFERFGEGGESFPEAVVVMVSKDPETNYLLIFTNITELSEVEINIINSFTII